jgi:hypothetical protein
MMFIIIIVLIEEHHWRTAAAAAAAKIVTTKNQSFVFHMSRGHIHWNGKAARTNSDVVDDSVIFVLQKNMNGRRASGYASC